MLGANADSGADAEVSSEAVTAQQGTARKVERLSSLEIPKYLAESSSTEESSKHQDENKNNESPIDKQIIERLSKLRGDDLSRPVPTDEEIKERLDRLKDTDSTMMDLAKRLGLEKQHAEQNLKPEDLMQQYLERLELERASKPDPYVEVESRLNALKRDGNLESQSSKQPKPREDDSDDEDAVMKRLIRRALAEATLEARELDGSTEAEVESTLTARQAASEEDELEAVDALTQKLLEQAFKETALESEHEDESTPETEDSLSSSLDSESEDEKKRKKKCIKL
ncbi:protein FAM133 isoform X2 [Orussus abietinus]|nr:protein FAM133 isoform X2 [Orussus abietinus]XP_012283668.1 protein FAM133 isoform X2 [Orussus abietinus]